MAILYSKRKLKTFHDGKEHYAITSKSLGTVGINELAQEMAAESTVTRHDIKAVVSSLEDHVLSNLRRGNTVKLGDLGSFSLILKSDLVNEPTEVNPSLVKGVKVRFTPSKAFKNAVRPDNEFVSFKPFYPQEEVTEKPVTPETPEKPVTPETPEKSETDEKEVV